MLSSEIPLKILLCDSNNRQAKKLFRFLGDDQRVHRLKMANRISAARRLVKPQSFNTIFIDPLSFDLDSASNFVFSIREALPEIVFILHVNFNSVEKWRSMFFRGERARFNHYYKLDKRISDSSLRSEIGAVLDLCQLDLRWRLSAASLEKLRDEVKNLEGLSKAAKSHSVPEKFEISKAIIEKMEEVLDELPLRHQTEMEPRSVFVSYRFEEREYFEGIKKLLTERGLRVVTGERANSSISTAIIERIKKSQCFLSLMTKHSQKKDGRYATSSWLVEEKGAAIALGKPIILLVEEKVNDIGGLQGDWQLIHFRPKGFLTAALQAVEQIASYAGIGAP